MSKPEKFNKKNVPLEQEQEYVPPSLKKLRDLSENLRYETPLLFYLGMF